MRNINNSKIKRYLCTRLFRAKSTNVFRYDSILDCDRFQIFKRPIGGRKIETALNEIVVISVKSHKLIIYPDYRYPMLNYSVRFDISNFPDLIPNSKIAYCRIIPYFRMISQDKQIKAWRLILTTDLGQIYHNYPSRFPDYDGESDEDDIIHFEESVVWDLPQRKYPSDIENCQDYERYYPGLPKQAYEYHPAVNQKSIYGNEGFPAYYHSREGIIPRFYISKRKPAGNPFYYMSGFCTDYKMTLLGTYNSNVSEGVRTCIFASHDGGRQWFCKYEFGDLGTYPFRQGYGEWGKNFGNAIMYKGTNLSSDKKFTLIKRECIIPNAMKKDPDALFAWGKEMTFEFDCNGKSITLKSAVEHSLETGNIVAISKAPEDFKWMINSGFGVKSAGNGLLFKVDKVDSFCICLYEYVASPDNPISCRHIHHINRVRDGWLIGTGETYPNSWILFMQMKEADTFSIKKADDIFDIFRLNSSETSVQRTLGVLWNEFADNTILFASDHDVLEKKTIQTPIPDRNLSFSRNATGIYIGNLADIDDYNKFIPIYEATEPAYLFQQLDRAIVFSGQRGELAISFDGGGTWIRSHIDGPLNHPKGGTYEYQIFDDYVLRIK